MHDLMGGEMMWGMGLFGLVALISRALRKEDLVGYRRRVGRATCGQVLEVRIGSGQNLPFFGPSVTEIIGLELSQPLIETVLGRARDDKAAGFTLDDLRTSYAPEPKPFTILCEVRAKGA